MPNGTAILDPSKRTERIMPIGGVDYWVDVYLQSTYGVPTPPESRWVDVRTLTRQVTGVADVVNPPRECKQVGTLQHVQQQWGQYYILPFKLEKRTSGVRTAGMFLVLGGAILLTATGIGAAIGAPLIVTAAGSLTAIGGASLAVGGVAVGSGGVAIRSAKDEDVKGAAAGPGFFQDSPMQPQPVVIDETPNVDQNQWHVCNASGQ